MTDEPTTVEEPENEPVAPELEEETTTEKQREKFARAQVKRENAAAEVAAALAADSQDLEDTDDAA